MDGVPLPRRLAAEALGTALLVAAIVGSGIMAERLSGGNVALALLANALASGAMLAVIILMFGRVSGAHFNPAVSAALLLRGEMPARGAASYMAAQILGGLAGVLAAHAMFGWALVDVSGAARSGPLQWLAEGIATFGLVGAILTTRRHGWGVLAAAVGLYIFAAYWFTASTSFANPAATLARALTGSFSGIAVGDVVPFIACQLAGAGLAAGFFGWLLKETPGA